MVMEFLVQNAGISVTVISFIVSLVISVIYKYTVDQKEAKANKDKMKDMQVKIKSLSKSGKQKEAMEMQKKMSEMSLSQMKSTFKPMIITMIVVLPVFLFLFPYLYAIDVVNLQDGAGSFEYQGQVHNIEYGIEDAGTTFESGGYLFEYGKYDAKDNELMVKRVVAVSPVSIPFAGNEVGWLGWYILNSIPFSILTRKILGVV